MNKPIIPSRFPILPPGQLQQIWSQLPPTNLTRLQHQLFFLVLEQVGGICHESANPSSTPTLGPSQGPRCPSQAAGRDLHSPIVSVSSREPPGESKTPVPTD